MVNLSAPSSQSLSMALLAYLREAHVSLHQGQSGEWTLRLSAANGVSERRIQADFVLPLLKAGLLKINAHRQAEVTAAGKSHLALRKQAGATLTLGLDHDGQDTRLINLAESPLKWLASRGGVKGAPYLLAHHVQAGERLRADFTFAQAVPRMGVDWSSTGSAGYQGDRLTVSETIYAARQRVSAALNAAGPELANVLVDVCGHCKGLELIESEHQWPARSAKIILRFALSALARHYGLSEKAVGVRRHNP